MQGMCICLRPIPLAEVWELSICDKIQEYGAMQGNLKIGPYWPKSSVFLRGVGKVGGPMKAFLDPLRKSESPESLWHVRGKGQVNDSIVAVDRLVESV